MIDGEQHKGLYNLSFDRRSPDCHNRLVREHRRALGNGVDVAVKFKISQIFQKLLVKDPLCAQVADVVIAKMQVFDVAYHLLKSGGNGKAAVVGNLAKKHVKIYIALVKAVFKISV